MENLIYADEFGLKGNNFYWVNRGRYQLTIEELKNAGMESKRVQIHRDILKSLQDAQQEFLEDGYSLSIKDGYRSRELYLLVYEKRVKKYGKENVERILNIQVMPHATGKAVDISLLDESGSEIIMRNSMDGPEALISNYYSDAINEKNKQYHALQQYMISVMVKHGFELGSLKEYFHFNYASPIF